MQPSERCSGPAGQVTLHDGWAAHSLLHDAHAHWASLAMLGIIA